MWYQMRWCMCWKCNYKMAKRSFIAIFYVMFLASLADKPPVAIRKCCGADEKLSFRPEKGLFCETVGERAPLWWLPVTTLGPGVRKLLEAGGNVEFGSQPQCAIASMDSLKHDPTDAPGGFKLHVRGGEVRLEAIKEETLHDPYDIRKDSFPTVSYCVDVGLKDREYIALLCPCQHVNCVRKCCSDGYVFNHTSGNCADADDMPIFTDWVPKLSSKFHYYRLVSKRPLCEKVTSHIVQTKSKGSQLILFPNASIQVPGMDSLLRAETYCGTYNTLNEEMLLHCFEDTKTEWTFLVYGVLFLVGAATLLITVIVTAILPEMRRNIHGRMSLAHNAMLFVGYTATGVSQLEGKTMRLKTCIITSFTIQFAILSAFFWLNVMCVDISWTFSGLRPIQGSAMQRDHKKFIYYSLYVWGSTSAISIATVIVEYTSLLTSIKPDFGTKMCFFNNHWAVFIFFYGPMALLLMANLFLFVYTAFKIFVVRRDTAILNTKDSSINAKNKQKLILYVKLFGLMGITYVTEVISWAVGGTSYWWYFTDTINILRAVFIFIIFCCKRTVYNTIRDKVLRLLGREVPNRQTSAVLTRSYQSHTSCTTASVAATPNSQKKLFVSPSNRGLSNNSLTSNLDLNMTKMANCRA